VTHSSPEPEGWYRADEQEADGAGYDAEKGFEQASDAAVAGGSD
jgi:hypothetical protein